MASGAVQIHYEERAFAVVQDTTRRVTIQTFPEFELVIITPLSFGWFTHTSRQPIPRYEVVSY